jgi:hypothetical protein
MQPSVSWPRRPTPFEGESFLSWFIRVSQANCVTPNELYRAALPRGHMYFADLDRYWSPDLILGLHEGTQVPVKTMRALTFHKWHGTLIAEDDGRSKLLWLPPIGNRQRIQSFGQQICPICLAEDETPYLRAIWRVSCLPACSQHNCLLADRCQNCASIIYPGNLVGSGMPISICWHCGFDMRKIAPYQLNNDKRRTSLANVSTALASGWVKLGPYGSVHPLLYFRLLWRVYRSLATGRFAYPLRDYTCSKFSLDFQVRAIPALRETDRINPHNRWALMQMTHELLDEWPSRFVNACVALGIRGRHLFKDRKIEPFALVDPIENIPSGTPPIANKLHMEQIRRHLTDRGIVPTQRQIRDLSGRKPRSLQKVAAPASSHVPYGLSRYWKLDGISPSVRELAKQAARREGETTAAWVEKAITETLSRNASRINTSIAGEVLKGSE